MNRPLCTVVPSAALAVWRGVTGVQAAPRDHDTDPATVVDNYTCLQSGSTGMRGWIDISGNNPGQQVIITAKSRRIPVAHVGTGTSAVGVCEAGIRGEPMKIKTEIAPGICGFDAVVTASTEDGQNVMFEFVTECENIKELAKRINDISPVDAIETLGPEENPILAAARTLLQTKGCCEACVVPVAMVKSMQVVAGLALPEDVSLKITRE